MFSKTRSAPAYSPAPGVGPGTTAGTPSNGSPIATDSGAAPAQPVAAPGRETRLERLLRMAHLARLHGFAILTVALFGFLIALAVSNTAHVKVNWVFGSSDVSLVWLVLFAAILGWLLGLVASARFHWLTRVPRRTDGTP